MDGALAFYADGPGSIPAVSKSKTKVEYSDGLSPSRYKNIKCRKNVSHLN